MLGECSITIGSVARRRLQSQQGLLLVKMIIHERNTNDSALCYALPGCKLASRIRTLERPVGGSVSDHTARVAEHERLEVIVQRMPHQYAALQQRGYSSLALR